MKHEERAKRLQPGEYSLVQEWCAVLIGNGKIKMVTKLFCFESLLLTLGSTCNSLFM